MIDCENLRLAHELADEYIEQIMKNDRKEDILFIMQELIDNCEGAMMCGEHGGVLHNFAYSIQDRIRCLRHNIESGLWPDMNECQHESDGNAYDMTSESKICTYPGQIFRSKCKKCGDFYR